MFSPSGCGVQVTRFIAFASGSRSGEACFAGESKSTLVSSSHTAKLKPTFADDAKAKSALTGAKVTLGLTDPDGGGLRGMPLLQRHMTISTHEVRPDKLDEYLELRGIAVNPGMARLHGFVSSDVLRKRTIPNAFFIVNQWLTKEDSDRYTEDSLHQYLKSRVRPLLISHSGTREFAVVTPEKE